MHFHSNKAAILDYHYNHGIIAAILDCHSTKAVIVYYHHSNKTFILDFGKCQKLWEQSNHILDSLDCNEIKTAILNYHGIIAVILDYHGIKEFIHIRLFNDIKALIVLVWIRNYYFGLTYAQCFLCNYILCYFACKLYRSIIWMLTVGKLEFSCYVIVSLQFSSWHCSQIKW